MRQSPASDAAPAITPSGEPLTAGAVSPAAPSIDKGQSVTLTANVLGGSPPYTYQWYAGTSSVCSNDSSVTGATLVTYAPGPTSRTYYCYEVKDSASSTATSSTDPVAVDPLLVSGSVTPTSPTIDKGEYVTLSANPSAGTPPYSYQWYSGSSTSCSGDSVIVGANSSTFSVSPASSAYYCYVAGDSSPGSPPAAESSGTDLVAVSPALLAANVTPATPTIDRGSVVKLTANAIGGTPPETYQWYSGSSSTCLSDSAVGGATSPTFAASPTSNTYYCYAVTDSATGPVTAMSATDLVTVDSTLAGGAVAPSSPTIDHGQTISLTANPVGGTPPYIYQWYNGSSSTCSKDSAILGATHSSYAASPGSTMYYCYTVTDSSTNASTLASGTDLVTVKTVLSVGSVGPASPNVDPGQTLSLTATPSGGTPPYLFQWFAGISSSCANDTPVSGATGLTYNATPTQNTYYCYSVSDSSTGSPPAGGMSGTDYVTVRTALVARPVSPSAPTIDVGRSVALTAVPSGGTPPYSYQWYEGSSTTCSGDSAIATATGPTYTATPGSRTYYCYVVTDSSDGAPPSSATSATDLVKVNPQLTPGAVLPNPTTVDLGQTEILSGNVTGGTPPYVYQWRMGSSSSCSSDAAILGATGASYAATPANTTTTYYCFAVTDNSTDAPVVLSSATPVYVHATLGAGSILPPPHGIDTGQAVTLTTNVSGGWGPYAYQWFGGASSNCSDDPALPGANASTYVAKPVTNTYYCYSVTDSSDGTPRARAVSAPDLVTVNPDPEAGPISPSSPVVDSGQPVTLVANPSEGTPPYAYQWYRGSSSTCADDASIAGATQSTYTAYPTSTTYYCYVLLDSSDGGPVQSQMSATDLVTVSASLQAGLVSPNAPTIDSGQTVTLQANPEGGTPPYSYQWYAGSSLGCSGETAIPGAYSSTYVASPNATTSYCYAASDSSTDPPTARSATDLVTVDPRLEAGGATPSSPGIDPHQSVTLAANPAGGTPPYHYQWLAGASSNCSNDSVVAGATGSTYAPSPSSVTYYCYVVTDSATTPSSARSASDPVSVNLALLANPASPASPTIDSGQSVSLTANPTRGTPPYRYQWYEGTNATCAGDTLIPGATGATYLASPQANSYFCYNATDSSPGTPPASAVSATDLVKVDPALAVGAVLPASVGIDAGQVVTLAVNVSGGTRPYLYQWYGGSSSTCSSDAAIAGATNSTIVVAPRSTTYYCYVASDNSTDPPSARSSTDLVSVNPRLSAGPITPVGVAIDVHQSLTLAANPIGGTPPYTFQWFSGSSANCSNDTAIPGATNASVTVTPTGPTYYCYEVKDSSKGAPPATQTSATELVTLNPALVAGAVSPGTPTVTGGQSITLHANASSGTPPYRYQWLSGPSATCAFDTELAGATSATLTVVPIRTAYYCYNVTDSSPGTPQENASSPTDFVTVTFAAEAVTPGSPVIDLGQTVSLTANPVGGTPPYFYQWYSGTSSSCSSDSAISGATGANLSLAAPSTAYYCYKAEDSASPQDVQFSPVDQVRVNPTLVVGSPGPRAPVLDNGSTVTLSANPSGGTTPYYLQWYVGSSASCASDSPIPGAVNQTLAVAPRATTDYCYVLTDSSTNAPILRSPTVVVTVAPALLAGAPTPGTATIDSGQSLLLTAHVSGGTPAYGYLWYAGSSSVCSSDSPIAGANSSTYLASPLSTMVYCYVATDGSTSPPSVASATVQINVSKILVANPVIPASPAIDSGESVTLSADPSGGTLPYQLHWYSGSSSICVDDQFIKGATGTSLSATLTVATYFCYTVADAATGTPLENQSSATVEVLVNTVLSAGAITPAAPAIDSGQSLTLTANPVGGTAPFSFKWYSGTASSCTANTPIAGATTATLIVAPLTSTHFCYVVTDSPVGAAAKTATSAQLAVTVNAALAAGPVVATATSITTGTNASLSANATGGTAPYSYRWYAGSSAICANDSAVPGITGSTYSPGPTMDTYYCYSVTDSSKGAPPVEKFSPTVRIHVTPAPATLFGLPLEEAVIILAVLGAIVALVALGIVLRVRRGRKEAPSDYL